MHTNLTTPQKPLITPVVLIHWACSVDKAPTGICFRRFQQAPRLFIHPSFPHWQLERKAEYTYGMLSNLALCNLFHPTNAFLRPAIASLVSHCFRLSNLDERDEEYLSPPFPLPSLKTMIMI
jgi:hypothetical protein